MAKRQPTRKDQSAGGKVTSDVVEQKVVALAEQLGWFLGTVRAKADGWLDREALRKELVHIRDGAAELLDQVNRTSTLAWKAGAKAAAAAKPMVAAKTSVPATPRASRGPVDAPGKRHRKPPPQESINRRMGEPVGKQMGQKSVKNSMRRGRG